MDINDLTIGQAKEIFAIFGSNVQSAPKGINGFCIGHAVIIRTYSAGVWCGTLAQKNGNEVVLITARRMWRWWCNESISLSGVVCHGINREKSRIAPAIPQVWLEAIEIMPISGDPLESIMEAENAKAE